MHKNECKRWCARVVAVEGDGVHFHFAIQVDATDFLENERRARVGLPIAQQVNGVHVGLGKRHLGEETNNVLMALLQQAILNL